nr:MAG TPA: hypothetical protein [Caudoviricetes sp.]
MLQCVCRWLVNLIITKINTSNLCTTENLYPSRVVNNHRQPFHINHGI